MGFEAPDLRADIAPKTPSKGQAIWGDRLISLRRFPLGCFLSLLLFLGSSIAPTASAVRAQEQGAVKAVSTTEEAIDKTDHFLRGEDLMDAGKFAEAEEAFHEAIQQDPLNPEYYAALGVALEIQERYAEAEVQYKEAVNLEPENPELHFELGTACERQEKWAAAEVAFREACNLSPENGFYRLTLAHVLQMSGREEEAQQEAEEGLSLLQDHEGIELPEDSSENWESILQEDSSTSTARKSTVTPGALDEQVATIHHWLGATVATLSPALALAFDREEQSGAIVLDVLDASPAAEGGLQTNDLIIGLDGRVVTDAAQLAEFAGQLGSARELALAIVREGEHHVLQIIAAGENGD